MPDYRELLGGGFKFIVVPIGFRQCWLMRKCPYSSGKKIDLVLYAKPYWKSRSGYQILKFNWELVNAKTQELVKNGSGSGILSKSYSNDKRLGGLIGLPYLVGKGNEYVLKIEVILGNEAILDKEEIFTFELHSSDKIPMIILSAFAGAAALYFLQWLIPWVISIMVVK
ncbi:MAG: hypothetical protein FJ005_04590 [Chloroflexi bacterium]|nr:hypothetical protein [Chloroflexota bacterium]